MRRIVAVSASGITVATLLLTGAVYLAAEDRQAITPSSSLSQSDLQTTTGAAQQSNQKPQAMPAPKSDEQAAEQQASQLAVEKPAKQPANSTHTRQVVISIPDRQLGLLEDGALIKVYPVAVGASDTPSPKGDFTIINHAVDPTYRHEGKEIAPGKDNPLGTRWMGLSLRGYGIHGTNVQSSVGKAASHGCFRMRKKDVEELYSRVRVGDAVVVRGERDELTDGLFHSDNNPGVAVAASKTETQIAAASN